VSVFAVVTGGGTSGHVIPALAIAEGLVARGHRVDEIHYVGTVHGVERRLVPPTGHPMTLLDVVGLQRSLSMRNLGFAPKMIRATRQAKRLLRELQPQVVVNVGGYASFPATYAAQRLGIPVVVVSYDLRPGQVSKLLARKAAAVAVAYPGSTLPRAEVTGAPVRQSIIDIDRTRDRAAARAALGWPEDRFVVAVSCGSLGSQDVNEVVAATVDRLADRGDLAVHHAVGDRFLHRASPERDGAAGILYRVVGYEERMPEVYAGADLLVTRAGAGTIAELATAGAPAIVVPWPGAAENHQVDNARQLSDHGAAILVEQRDLTAERLAAEIERLMADRGALATLATNAADAGALIRTGALIDVVERAAGGAR
jgi:UDP-N-acetylglucosamine--N-acetylmuramyl-(pentapeptide) pyrophosphoryl-undecaprenol N-acetylglucosamine transferase